MNDIILGIDLGTTNSAVGAVDSGFPILLADDDGKRIAPSAVWIGADGSVEVGAKALRRRAPKSLDPATVMTPKRSASSRPNPNEQINVSANPLGNAAVVASRSSRTMRAGSSSASLGGGGGSMINMARAASWKPKGGF